MKRRKYSSLTTVWCINARVLKYLYQECPSELEMKAFKVKNKIKISVLSAERCLQYVVEKKQTNAYIFRIQGRWWEEIGTWMSLDEDGAICMRWIFK